MGLRKWMRPRGQVNTWSGHVALLYLNMNAGFCTVNDITRMAENIFVWTWYVPPECAPWRFTLAFSISIRLRQNTGSALPFLYRHRSEKEVARFLAESRRKSFYEPDTTQKKRRDEAGSKRRSQWRAAFVDAEMLNGYLRRTGILAGLDGARFGLISLAGAGIISSS